MAQYIVLCTRTLDVHRGFERHCLGPVEVEPVGELVPHRAARQNVSQLKWAEVQASELRQGHSHPRERVVADDEGTHFLRKTS